MKAKTCLLDIRYPKPFPKPTICQMNQLYLELARKISTLLPSPDFLNLSYSCVELMRMGYMIVRVYCPTDYDGYCLYVAVLDIGIALFPKKKKKIVKKNGSATLRASRTPTAMTPTFMPFHITPDAKCFPTAIVGTFERLLPSVRMAMNPQTGWP